MQYHAQPPSSNPDSPSKYDSSLTQTQHSNAPSTITTASSAVGASSIHYQTIQPNVSAILMVFVHPVSTNKLCFLLGGCIE